MNSFFLRVAVGSLAFATATATGFAADLSRRAPVAQQPMVAQASAYNWTGLYAGVNLGGDWVLDKARVGGGNTNIDGATVFGGVQAGYNFQTGPWVLGVEGDIGYGDSSKTKSVIGGTLNSQKDWSGTARARAGYAFDNFLVYGTGGLAVANFRTKASDGFTTEKKSDVRAGWTIGGGVEYAVARNISVKGEYLYSDYGRENHNFGNVGPVRQDVSDHLVRVGLNYKF
ncbi:porin family protein [Siculibacillus lacustris]|uniref:Porin family protein n=1 Tax=Siculibacillus lacustris TaxID=1549641 RepID=A0A4V2KSX4_9HYPH|nr:outer membrane protein [Siculibacillus lacustris]TBW34720.1 porin family protein [Siculibacillus lacustris]